MKLRPYQAEAERAIYAAWAAGDQNHLCVLPTGAGKTVVMSSIINKHVGASCAIAHRQELVCQISKALNACGVWHRVVGNESIIKLCTRVHMREHGKSFYDPSSKCAVIGIGTLLSRKAKLKTWLSSVTLWIIDEGHHLLEDNQWGKGVALLPNAKGLGFTASPTRADGRGLGSHADGNYNSMSVGPTGRDLINIGYLTDYKIYCPDSGLDLTGVKTGKNGEYTDKVVDQAVGESRVIGDVVSHYLRIAPGKLGVTFANNIEKATELAMRFNEAGVPAAVVSSKNTDSERVEIINRFRNREIMQLVNVDLVGEGFDLPAIEVVSMARPTASYGLFLQQFGRALRLMEGKEFAIIIDHVGNVLRHGLPDRAVEWTLDSGKRDPQSDPDVIPLRGCLKCSMPYEAFRTHCTHCGYKPVPALRKAPEQVDGDLVELDPETLAIMRGEIEKIDMSIGDFRIDMSRRHVPHLGQLSQAKKHIEKQETQKILRDAVNWWAAFQRVAGYSDSESYKLFYLRFGIDVMSAQALKKKEAVTLTEKINTSLLKVTGL